MSQRIQDLEAVLTLTRSLAVDDKLRLISLLSEDLRDEIDREGERVHILSTAGPGAELWREVDVEEYLERERETWDHQTWISRPIPSWGLTPHRSSISGNATPSMLLLPRRSSTALDSPTFKKSPPPLR